ncbi:MAG TPA: hypothetical protein VHZ24_15520 [Pirellulales bacterium]|jgi:serine/threonine protein phosphatase PrpC|nr:hypothetical protein [Pirellulales bacterium]
MDLETNFNRAGRSTLENQLSTWFMRRTAVNGVRRVASVFAAVATDVGGVRSENQDRLAIARIRDRTGRAFILAALADGMGGMREGAECAATTLACLIGGIAERAQASDVPRDWLLHSASVANVRLHAKFKGKGGSTLSTILASGTGDVCWLSVGDSRVYVTEGKKLTQISVDDTIAGQLASPAQLGPDHSKLLQYVGIGESLEPHIDQFQITVGNSILLTSDGAHYLPSQSNLFGLIVEHAADPGTCVHRLVELSKWSGGADNASAAMVTWEAGSGNETRQTLPALEVWDPFGELQILWQVSPREAPQERVAPVPPPDMKRKPPNKQPGSSNKRRSRGGHKVKPKPQPRRNDSGGDEVPQLLIEFPNKKGT